MMLSITHREKIDLTPALRTWAFKNGITPAKFQEVMGYRGYSHAWNVIARNGKGRFSVNAWGKFIQGFGMAQFQEICKIAGVEFEGSDAQVS